MRFIVEFIVELAALRGERCFVSENIRHQVNRKVLFAVKLIA